MTSTSKTSEDLVRRKGSRKTQDDSRLESRDQVVSSVVSRLFILSFALVLSFPLFIYSFGDSVFKTGNGKTWNGK